jgi:hypothetical protein
MVGGWRRLGRFEIVSAGGSWPALVLVIVLVLVLLDEVALAAAAHHLNKIGI